MSETRFNALDVVVSTFAGPEGQEVHRRSVQVGVGSLFIQMSLPQWRALRAACKLLGPDCGPPLPTKIDREDPPDERHAWS